MVSEIEKETSGAQMAIEVTLVKLAQSWDGETGHVKKEAIRSGRLF